MALHVTEPRSQRWEVRVLMLGETRGREQLELFLAPTRRGELWQTSRDVCAILSCGCVGAKLKISPILRLLLAHFRILSLADNLKIGRPILRRWASLSQPILRLAGQS